MEFSPTVLIWAPIGLLFLSAIAGVVIERHRRDACLKEFDGDFVILKMKDGRSVWGVMKVFPKCIELVYDSPQAMGLGRSKSSYVLYDKKIADIDRIIRPAPSEGTSEREEWDEEVADLKFTSFFEKIGRSLRNLYGMLRDAFSQSVGMLIGMAKQRSAALQKVSGADRHATEVGQSLLEILPNAYEPILEKYRGALVVLESLEEGEVQETLGVLEDYTVGNLLIRAVDIRAEDVPEGLKDRGFRVGDVIFPRSRAVVRHRIMETEV
ncbi:hypothetical protein [Pelagicoccus mobilis]|uniref:Uncharacterized protein n=1 Tax=Pelagicoccus mobilis TaxID=415221 RepID=A0A934VRC3_9BACT|nr:hypothetical protein [Pelagicoccus mobilis]MBK1877790.1 hypothetical protein [Pelagicoccus mobilis]